MGGREQSTEVVSRELEQGENRALKTSEKC